MPSYAGDRPGRVVAVVLALAVVLVPWRSGIAGVRGVPWAEDGRFFLQQDYVSGPWATLLRPYEGYVHVPARLVALLVDPFPIAWHGVLVRLAAIVVQGLLAGFAYCVVRTHVRARAIALMVPLVVTLVVVGPETVDNLANLQWYLLYAACLAPLSTWPTASARSPRPSSSWPRRWPRRSVPCRSCWPRWSGCSPGRAPWSR